MNIIEEVQKASGYAPVHKVDPNTQTPLSEGAGQAAQLSQAAIPAILTGLYKYTRREENAQNIVRGANPTNTTWTDEIFGAKSDEIVRHVASYAHVSNEKAELAMDDAAKAAIQVAHNALGKDASAARIAGFFKDNRSEILMHLPASLQLGYLINDNTVDDRTNKMEGPVSGLMHTIEKFFSDSDANDSSKQ